MDKDIPEIQPDIETKVSDESPEQTAEAPLSLDDEIAETRDDGRHRDAHANQFL